MDEDKYIMLSVCVTTYNHVNFIEQCLNSILNISEVASLLTISSMEGNQAAEPDPAGAR